MVILFVGEEEKKFHIHKKLLCDKVPAFEAMFRGGFKEAEEGIAYLPEDKPVAVELLVEWLYRGYLSALSTDDNMDRQAVRSLTRSTVKKWTEVFCFAEKYCIDTLMDHSLTLIKSTHKKQRMYYSCVMMAYGYDSTHEGSRLRLYILRTICYITLEKDNSEAWPTDDIENLFRETPDLSDDFVAAIRGRRREPSLKPHEFPQCDYHQHDPATICPYLTKSIEVMVSDSDAHRSKKRKIAEGSKSDVIEVIIDG